MTDTQTPPEEVTTQTPTDSPAPAPKKIPKRGLRYAVTGKNDEGEWEGDIMIYQLASSESDLPTGCMVPIPNVPRFKTTSEALRWAKFNSGDLLAGKQVMIFHAKEILNVDMVQRTEVKIVQKPKFVVNGPEREDE